MPILTLQKSMRRLGRIRMGSQVATTGGKTRPNKLETWRLTSPSAELLEAAAAMYGGQVAEWAGSPNGKQFELFTESDSLEVVIPPGDMAFSQWFELWSGGGCLRRCDGQTEITSGEPCMCPADPEARLAAAQKGQACKPTTRLFVIQPRLPDVGLWHFESHGFYAATEIPGTINVIRAASANGMLVPARLRIEQRTVKRDGKTNSFAVPVIELPTLTTHTLMTGEVVGGQLPSGDRAELAPVRDEPAAAPAAAVVPAGAPSQVDTPSETGRPLPSAGSGDGAVFRRAILNSARKVGLDGDALDSLSRSTIGKPFAEMTDPKEANELLAAINGQKAS